MFHSVEVLEVTLTIVIIATHIALAAVSSRVPWTQLPTAVGRLVTYQENKTNQIREVNNILLCDFCTKYPQKLTREEIPSYATYPSRPSFDCRMSHYCHLLLSSRTALHSGALKGKVTKSWLSTLITQMVCVKTTCCRNSRMLALSLDMAATASSCVANSTSASPVTLPSGPISMWTRTGFSGEKNWKRFTEVCITCTSRGVRFY